MIKIDYIGNKAFVFDKKMSPILRRVIKCAIPVWDIVWHIALVLARLKRDRSVRKYKFSICAIFKNETLQLKEWIEYHRMVGVEHLYLYNNFSEDNYLSVLAPYVEENYVTLTEWKIPPPSQVSAYQHFKNHYSKETQWVAFMDLDEFICMKECDDIKDWISKYDKYPSLVAYWKCFGANGRIEHDKSQLLIEQYYTCWDRLYDYGKPFFNFSFEVYGFHKNFIHELPAALSLLGGKVRIKIPPINEFKKFVHFRCNRIGFFHSKDDFTIQINHYVTKAYLEYFISKRKRGTAASTGEVAKHIRSSYAYLYHNRHCITTDFTIQRYLTELKVRMDDTIINYFVENDSQ